METVKVRTGSGKFGQEIQIGRHRLAADEPATNGGGDAAPSPHELVLAGLGACTSMTLKMYAERKGWPLERVEVDLTLEKEGESTVIRRAIRLSGGLDAEQRTRLLEIAGKCPVHKTLAGEIRIETRAADATG